MREIRFVPGPISFLWPFFVLISLFSLFSCPSPLSSPFSLSLSVLWMILWEAASRAQQLPENQVLPVQLLVLKNETITRRNQKNTKY